MESHIKDLINTVSRSNPLDLKEETSTSCNEESIRILPHKREKAICKPLKRHLKDIKTCERLKAFSFDEGRQVEPIEIKINISVIKGEEERTNLNNNFMSVHSFRVSDYLMWCEYFVYCGPKYWS